MPRMIPNLNKESKRLLRFMIIAVLVIILVVVYFIWRGTGFYVLSAEQRISVPEPYEPPEDAVWYTVDNARFGIDNTGEKSRETTDGINNALVWAKARGYTHIKFADGHYLIQCTWNNRYIAPTDGILVPSGLTLDLGNAAFYMEKNSYPAYCIFGIVDQSDVKIIGGTLIGDTATHVYAESADSHSHEWGFGICVSASSDVLIQNVTIKDMTGDGIILEGSYQAIADGGRVSSHIKVINCDISACRRQGISVVGAENTEIAGNRIYDISGTNPQFGIDVEPEFDYSVAGLRIHGNTISGCSGGAISCNSGEGYSVSGNICTGNSIIAVFCSDVQIHGNIIRSSKIQIYEEAQGAQAYGNQFDLFSRRIIED